LNPIHLLALANFLFVSSYGLLGLNAIFFPLNQVESLQQSVYLGLGLFGATQVGAAWFLDRIAIGLSVSQSLLVAGRLLGAGLLLIPNIFTIPIGYLLFGLSSAIFYKRSRKQLAQHLSSVQAFDASPYTIFSLTTNIAYMVAPLAGSLLLNFSNFYFIGGAINIALALISILTYRAADKVMPLANINEKSAQANMAFDAKEFFEDVLRLTGLILPYAIVMALIPIKVNSLSLSSSHSSVLFSLNALIVVVFQLALSRLKLFKYNVRRYDFSLIVSTALCGLAIFGNYFWMVVAIALWSFFEAYQLPSVEYHLFKMRTYSDERLNQLLGIDAVVCFAGPFLASWAIGLL
jgi:hypothetical protein